MKFKINLLVLLFLLFPSFCFFKEQVLAKNLDSIIRYKKEQLIKIKRKKEDLKKLKENILKMYIALYTKKLYKDDLTEFLKNPDYLVLFKEEEKFDFIEKALLKKLTEIKEEEIKLDEAHKKILRDIEKLKAQKALAINPLNGRPIDLGNHILKIKEPSSIFSPIDGVVKSIVYKHNEMSVFIEGKNCKAILSNLEEVSINIGEKVVKRQVIGNVKTPKDFHLSITCK